MENTLTRIKALPVDNHTPYYTVKARQNHVIKAKQQVLQVISGVAWVSNKGEDFIIKPGDAITLFRGGDAVVTVSGLFGKPVKYTLSNG